MTLQSVLFSRITFIITGVKKQRPETNRRTPWKINMEPENDGLVQIIFLFITPPKFNIASEKWWLEDESPFGKAYFQGLCYMLNFRGVIFRGEILAEKIPKSKQTWSSRPGWSTHATTAFLLVSTSGYPLGPWLMVDGWLWAKQLRVFEFKQWWCHR